MKDDAFTSWATKQATKRKAPKPPVPAGRKPKVSNDDADENITGESEALPAAVWYIAYRDSKGNESERHITVKGISSKDSVKYLTAWCHEQESFRSFRVDRVIEAHDLATGEVYIEADDILPAFTEFMREITSDPIKNSQKALKDCSAVLNILMFLSRCDGQTHPTEIDVALQYIGDRWFEFELDDKVLVRHVQRLYPTKEEYIEAIESTYKFKDEKFRQRVRKYAALMIEADGVVLPEEYSAAAIIDEVKSQREENKRRKEEDKQRMREAEEEKFWQELENSPHVFKFSISSK